MKYSEYLRKVRKAAMQERNPFLCCVNEDVVWPAHQKYKEHMLRLRRALNEACVDEWGYGRMFLPTALKGTRPDFCVKYKGNNKHIRIGWLTEQIKAADAEECK